MFNLLGTFSSWFECCNIFLHQMFWLIGLLPSSNFVLKKKKNPCLQCDCIFCTLPSWSGHICFGAYSSLGALPDGPWQMPTIAVALGWRAVPPPDLKKKKKKIIPKFPNITVFPFGLPCFYSWFTSHYILSFTVCCPYFYLNSSVCLTSHLGFHISSPLLSLHHSLSLT